MLLLCHPAINYIFVLCEFCFAVSNIDDASFCSPPIRVSQATQDNEDKGDQVAEASQENE